MPLGEVRLLPLTGADHVAQFVAYAASVRKSQSDPEAIARIGEELGRATQEESSIQVIHCPLLGAGAGHLDSETVVARLSQGFRQECRDGSLLRIFVLNKDVLRAAGPPLGGRSPDIGRSGFGALAEPVPR